MKRGPRLGCRSRTPISVSVGALGRLSAPRALTVSPGWGKIRLMADRPRFLCPQCGRNLRGMFGTCCPDCGFVVGHSRAQYRGAVRYWRFLRARNRVEFVLTLLWIVGLVVAYRVMALAPSVFITVLIVVAAIAMVGLARYLTFQRKRGK